MKLQQPVKLQSLLRTMQVEVLTDEEDVDVSGCYLSDMLSDVLAHAEPGALWITIQVHRNVISVATMKDLAAVLFTSGRRPDPSVVAEANEAGVVLLSTPLSSYEAAAKLWEAGLR